MGLVFLASVVQHSFAEEKGRAYYEKTGDVIWDVKTDEKVIALTFDDGPHSKFTPQILDLLAKYNAKATFFVIGEHAEEYPDLILREKKEGHEIANHTYTHPHSGTVAELEKELIKTDQAIFKITGTYPIFYRPVGGNYNERIINTAVQNGLRVVMWSWHQDTEDWKRPGVNQIVSKVLSGAKAGDVVLFHDAGGDRSQTVRALEEILPALKEKGYEFVTVSELINKTGIEVLQ
ncbi:polysaccharide deacetylase family protein [Bacillus sp. FJAT-50079]|uniref:polysaccharide deacetylase family protein n=1 Tax=Bacillus sp. FJAT-50079 TaxID=2833577 RepID=UPI001BC991E5|nr:polysaccharide deacetylase family protein [Bacillus sp. FJAT-50079]MBS4206553.1 polysaccharide deacetylase family protein [Bacillus sp. FJAT-50079]